MSLGESCVRELVSCDYALQRYLRARRTFWNPIFVVPFIIASHERPVYVDPRAREEEGLSSLVTVVQLAPAPARKKGPKLITTYGDKI